jgi:GDP-L-fucose synthase
MKNDFFNKKKVLITGARGMVGKSLVKRLEKEGQNYLLLPTSEELDLRNQKEVEDYFNLSKPEYVFHLAAKVGGISANINAPAEFLYDNLMIETNVIESARKNDVKKLLFLGSSCIYPRNCPQPMKEEYLLSGKLEPTNEGYALAKICGLKLCEYYNKQHGTNFINLMPPNIYGINDHFNSEKSHVISSLITKFCNAKDERSKSVEIWGTGISRREFLFVDDVADAMVYFMKNYSAQEVGSFVNIGSGRDISIKDLAFLIKDLVGYNGGLEFDPSKPDGMPKKLLDNSKATNLGWKAKTSLEEGLRKTIEWYCKSFK